MGVKTVMVECFRDAKVLKSYDFGYGETIGPSAPPEREGVIAEAKFNLVSQGLAKPPFAGITFNVRYL